VGGGEDPGPRVTVFVKLTTDTRIRRRLPDPAMAVASIDLEGPLPMPEVVLRAGRAELERLRDTVTEAIADLDARDTPSDDTAGGGS